MGAGAPHPVQERDPRYRECRRRHRQGHGPALHLCVLPVELGSRRRLHHPPGRDRRSQGVVPDRAREEILMLVKRFSEAKTYEAPNHRAYSSLRLSGADARGPKQFLIGLSHFLPGGGAGPDSSPTEKVYVVLSGELAVIVGGQETALKAHHSRFLAPKQ